MFWKVFGFNAITHINSPVHVSSFWSTKIWFPWASFHSNKLILQMILESRLTTYLN